MLGAEMCKRRDRYSVRGSRETVACLAMVAASLALAVTAPSASAAPTVYVANGFSESVSAYSVAADGSLNPVAGSPFPDEVAPLGLAMSPDGEHLYVTNFESNSVSAFSVAADGSLSPVSGSPFATGTWPWGVAMSPDGEHLYVANDGSNNVSAYSVAADGSLHAIAGSPFSTGSAVGGMLSNGVAVSPDGKHLYVTNQGPDNISAFSISANGALTPIAGAPFAAGQAPRAATISPDGKYLYVVDASGGNISAYLIATDGVLSPIAGSPFATEGAPVGVAASPDGEHIYVVHVGAENNVWGYTIAPDGSLSPVTGAPFATGGLRSNSVAVSPDGRHLYETNNTSKNVSAFSIASNGSLDAIAGSPFAAGSGPLQVAVRPDQGPVAAFVATSTPSGDPSSFNASTSSDPDGAVASYEWDFGDGQSEVTPSATTTHAYFAPGEYTVTLTVTDDEGCSTTQTFTGQTVSCNGSSQAQASHEVTVPPGVPLGVSLAGTGSGSVTSSPQGIACPEACSYAYEPDTAVTLTATPSPGSTFTGWSGAGCSGTASTCEVPMSEAEATEAEFTINTYALKVATAGPGSGEVGSTPAGIGECGSPAGVCEASYDYGTVIALEAHPAPGSTFTGWSGGGCSGTGACQVTLKADAEVGAAFSEVPPASPTTTPPSTTPPNAQPRRPAHLRIGRVRSKLVRSRCAGKSALITRLLHLRCAGLKVVVWGTIAKAARGSVRVEAKAYLHRQGHRQPATATGRDRIHHGRWRARLNLPRAYRSPKASIYIAARFQGGPGLRSGYAKRRVSRLFSTG